MLSSPAGLSFVDALPADGHGIRLQSSNLLQEQRNSVWTRRWLAEVVNGGVGVRCHVLARGTVRAATGDVLWRVAGGVSGSAYGKDGHLLTGCLRPGERGFIGAAWLEARDGPIDLSAARVFEVGFTSIDAATAAPHTGAPTLDVRRTANSFNIEVSVTATTRTLRNGYVDVFTRGASGLLEEQLIAALPAELHAGASAKFELLTAGPSVGADGRVTFLLDP